MKIFRANGEDLELPEVSTVDLDEAIVLYNYSGLTLDQLEDLEGLHPGVLAGLVHIAVARANPDMKAKDIEKAVRKLNLADLLASVKDEKEKEPEPDLLKHSNKSSGGNGASSGDTSKIHSVPDQESPDPVATGMPESGSSASLRTELVG